MRLTDRHPVVTIRGSWGDLIVHRATGHIIERRPNHDVTEDEPGYSDITFFLPETLAPGRDDCLDKHGETDILATGYACLGGDVMNAMSMVEDEDGFAIYDDLLRLPAPSHTKVFA